MTAFYCNTALPQDSHLYIFLICYFSPQQISESWALVILYEMRSTDSENCAKQQTRDLATGTGLIKAFLKLTQSELDLTDLSTRLICHSIAFLN